MEFMLENKKFDLAVLEANHFFETAYDLFLANQMNASIVLEGTEMETYMEAESKKVKAASESFFNKIGKAIEEFIDEIKKKFFEADSTKKLNDAKEAVKKNSKKAEAIKVDAESFEMNADDLNKYIQEMVKIERELLNLKASESLIGYQGNQTAINIEIAKIMRKAEKLQDKFDEELLDKNKKVINMALTDAIRFSDKQLENVKVDAEALKSGSKKILKEFQKDANGCDVPAKQNAIRKLGNMVGTMTRKYYNKKTSVAGTTIKTVVGIIGVKILASVAKGYIQTKTNELANSVMNNTDNPSNE